MNYIDQKLFDLGYTIQDEGDGRATYAKKLFEFDEDRGKIQSDYCKVVEIYRFFDKEFKSSVVISSHLMGESCSWGGHHCSEPLSLEEMTWFLRKSRWLKLKWGIKNKIFGLKRLGRGAL